MIDGLAQGVLPTALSLLSPHSPRLAVGLHVVGGGDVVGPDIVLPLEEPEDAAEDAPRVDPHPHVQLHVRRLHHVAARGRRERDVA